MESLRLTIMNTVTFTKLIVKLQANSTRISNNLCSGIKACPGSQNSQLLTPLGSPFDM